MHSLSASINYKYVIGQNSPVTVKLSASAAVQTVTLWGMPSSYLITGIRTLLVTQFTGTGLTSLTVQLGVVGSTNYYSPAFELTATPSDSTFLYWSPLAMYTTTPYDIIATFTAVGALLHSLPTGEIEISLKARSF